MIGMATPTKKNNAKLPRRKVPSNKPVDSGIVSDKTKQEEDEVGLGVVLNSHLPRSFKNRAEMDAHIRWLRE